MAHAPLVAGNISLLEVLLAANGQPPAEAQSVGSILAIARSSNEMGFSSFE